ncbi:Fur family transcriptional regulator [Alterisphingorhabdus coralli]|uniref:Fur family transcriptional regulator n=1 Tax=Alterisphingorhabdus coralli TaxID=3071408 RepID=A0AA97F990_9SPHN|nr:Fur family transcriptional regulator [Parasphingorhabdus sp. SCSIO 66989]WOE75607.1 Fur family transcriptional regulator [Parasphingorhabdus sp. SCSIO 66989]
MTQQSSDTANACADHEHREHHGADLTLAAQRKLEQSGERWTEMRATVFAALADISKPASAYDIADAVSQRRGKRAAPNSVYRILDLFVETNLARRVESANAYVANSHPDCLHDCIFMICDKCGSVVHMDDDSVSAQLRDAADKAGFANVRPVIEVRGRCRDCK